MVKYANLEDAKIAVKRWAGDPSSIEHIGDRGNSVFSFKNPIGELQILRFTDPDFRSFDEILAELNFVNHLKKSGVPVAESLETEDGAFAFQSECSSGTLICSSVAYAQGLEVIEGSSYWSPDFFKEWGKNLALIHKASMTYLPKTEDPKRWQWDEEILIAKAEQLIPASDKKSLQEFHEVLSLCKNLPKNRFNFGLIHADHAPQNFRFDLKTQSVVAFDFGNCCYHWFISDLAISLSTVRRKMNRDKIRSCILEGYTSILSLPDDLDSQLELLIRLRVIYVYLSRLHLWSENRTSEQEKDLNTFKNLVHLKSGWNLPS